MSLEVTNIMATKKVRDLAGKLGAGTVYNLFGNSIAGIITILVSATGHLTVEQATLLQGSVATFAALTLLVINHKYEIF